MMFENIFGGGEIKKCCQRVRDHPDDPEAHFQLGAACERRGKIPEAIDAFKETLRLAPRSAEAHFNLGVLFEKTGDGDNAIVHMNKAGTLFSERGDEGNKERARKRLRQYYEKFGFRGKEGGAAR